jgi:hypothetical protein
MRGITASCILLGELILLSGKLPRASTNFSDSPNLLKGELVSTFALVVRIQNTPPEQYALLFFTQMEVNEFDLAISANTLPLQHVLTKPRYMLFFLNPLSHENSNTYFKKGTTLYERQHNILSLVVQKVAI